MIVYRLICAEGHEFDGWFRDSAAYDAQAKAGAVECPECGTRSVQKALMAPNLGAGTRKRDPEPVKQPAALAKSDDMAPQEIVSRMQALGRKLRAHVETNFDYVGDKFAEEARKIHNGEADERGIYGEAKGSEVKELVEEGIAVAPLPDAPDKAN